MEQILYSALESKRFNANIYRCNTDSFDYTILNDHIINHKVDVLILRLPTSTKSTHYNLLKLPYPVLHADTLVYYKCDLSKISEFPLRDNLLLVQLTPDDKKIIKGLIPTIFEGYQNHYFSNPLFDRTKITEGYIEWASSFWEDTEKVCWGILNAEKQIVAFVCGTISPSKKNCELILAGVVPEFSNQGLYTYLIQQVQSFLKDNDYKEVSLSTQIQNIAVQRAWIKSGFNLAYSLDTYHINSRLGNWHLENEFKKF